MTAADGDLPAGRPPAPAPPRAEGARTLCFQVAGGLLRGRTPADDAGPPPTGMPTAMPTAMPDRAAGDTGSPVLAREGAAGLGAAGVGGSGDGMPDTLSLSLGAVAAILAGSRTSAAPARRPEPESLPSRRRRAALPVPRPRHWYHRPVPAALAAGGLLTVTATGLADVWFTQVSAGTVQSPEQAGSGAGLRGSRIAPETLPATPPGALPGALPGGLPQPLPRALPTPAEVFPTKLALPASTGGTDATGVAAGQGTSAPSRTTRKSKRKARPTPTRTRPAPTSGTGTGSGGGSTTPPTGIITIGPG